MDSNAFSNFLYSINSNTLHVLDASIPNSKYVPIDLSKDNHALQKIDLSASSPLENFVNTHIKDHNAIVAFGGYNEIRTLYKRSTHFNFDDDTERNIHLGIDLWCKAETPIYAPLESVVHSFNNNTNLGDYGPTIILKHDIENVIFYTLYGHLSLASIEKLKIGQTFKKGEQLATLGTSKVNGDYPPHLHFQIIRNIEGYKGDYPGVCNKDNLNFYLENCPNPETLLKLSSQL